MEMRFNITSNEYGDVNEYQIKQIVCTAINNMLWYFIEIAVAANLIFFVLVMGCMYFWKPSRFIKGKMTVEMEDMPALPPNDPTDEDAEKVWKSIAAMVSNIHCNITEVRCEEFEAPPSYDELVRQHDGCADSQSNYEKKCPGYVLINVEQK